MSSITPTTDRTPRWSALLGALAIVSGQATATEIDAAWDHDPARFSLAGYGSYADTARLFSSGLRFSLQHTRERAPFAAAVSGMPALLSRFPDDPALRPHDFVADLKLGFRLDFAHTRSGAHGPLFLQFKISRHAPEIRASIPVPRHTSASLTLGTEF